MHTFSETGSGVPAFLAKLWRLVEDTETNNLIYWSKDGRSFVIQNQAQFARDLLPLNYKHNNMASFIRQLNMYGFHKITSIDNGGLKFDRDEMEFSHPYFKRGCPYLLEHIKRKIANTKLQQNLDDKNSGGGGNIKSESVNKVLNEVKVMRTRQETLDSRFNVMKQENEALWREIATLRQKHIKQQQLVNKLIQFLVTIVQPSRNMSGVKRHFQLMINDAPHSSKMRKASESESGPIIHELTEELLDEVAEAAEDTDELFESSSPNMNVGAGGFESPSNIERPQSNLSLSNPVYDNSNQSSGGSDEICYNLDNNSPKTVYHISEIPENIAGGDEINYIEENCLNTPMVKQEMARNKQLQQHLQQQQQQLKNEQKQQQQRFRRKRSETTNITSTHPSSSSAATTAKTINASNKSTVHIKTENDLDPSIFLDVNLSADGASKITIDPALISPNSNSSQAIPSTSVNLQENIINDNSDVAGGGSGNYQQNIKQTDKQLYSTGDFINTEMPSDIFDESGSFGTNIDLSKLGNISSSSIATNPANGCLSDKNLAVTKYNNEKNLSNEDILRLNTLDDVTTHIDSCENDLDNIKDLLRGEGYSLDSNALMGNGNNLSTNRLYLSSPLDNDILAKLFSDADILNPYGISSSLPNENFPDNNKTGSELMTYQPYSQDFSDILDMNNKSTDYDDETSKSQELAGSILNTPYREERE